MTHLFVDISSHGFGHLAQTAPVLNALSASRPLQLTIRSGLSKAQLARRIHQPFTHLHEASDFGFVMHDALRVDLASSAQRYQEAYANWPERVEQEAALLTSLQPRLVLSNISPLPIAGAAKAGIACMAMCSLNWADLFAHYFAAEPWAAPIHAAMQHAYASAQQFLRFTPGMPMPALNNLAIIGPVSTAGSMTREAIAQQLDLPLNKRWLLLAMGGIAHRLPVEDWPHIEGVQFLIPADWGVSRSDCSVYDDSRLPFSNLFPRVDAVLTKPGYGTFAEAACCGLPVLYLRRPDWPEEPYLIEWLHANTRASELTAEQAATGELGLLLHSLWRQPAPIPPKPTGIAEALRHINQALDANVTIAP